MFNYYLFDKNEGVFGFFCNFDSAANKLMNLKKLNPDGFADSVVVNAETMGEIN